MHTIKKIIQISLRVQHFRSGDISAFKLVCDVIVLAGLAVGVGGDEVVDGQLLGYDVTKKYVGDGLRAEFA